MCRYCYMPDNPFRDFRASCAEGNRAWSGLSGGAPTETGMIGHRPQASGKPPATGASCVWLQAISCGFGMVPAFFRGVERLCCTNRVWGSSAEASMLAGGHEQLDPYDIQDHELAFVQCLWRKRHAALKQRGSLSIWFAPEMSWRPPPTGKRGRQPDFSDTVIQVCLRLKVLFGMPLHQTTGLV